MAQMIGFIPGRTVYSRIEVSCALSTGIVLPLHPLPFPIQESRTTLYQHKKPDKIVLRDSRTGISYCCNKGEELEAAVAFHEAQQEQEYQQISRAINNGKRNSFHN